MIRIVCLALALSAVEGLALSEVEGLLAQATQPTPPPKGLMPDLGRPTKPDDKVPLLDFGQYFVGRWTFTADAPDTVLGPGGESSGTVTYRKLADGFFEALIEGKSEQGPFTIRETIAYHAEQKMAFRHVTDSRGYSYVQMAEVGGNIGGDYRLFFQGAPFTFKGKMVRLNHTIYLAAPLTFRIDLAVAEGSGPFIHMSPWRLRRVQ